LGILGHSRTVLQGRELCTEYCPPALDFRLVLMALPVPCFNRYRTVDVAAASGSPSAIATAGLAWDYIFYFH
jgi:hypothetical protein